MNAAAAHACALCEARQFILIAIIWAMGATCVAATLGWIILESRRARVGPPEAVWPPQIWERLR